MWNDEIINNTLFFANKAHSEQKMIYPNNVPYSSHIVGVLLVALNYVKDEEIDWTYMAQLALLHDTLEDTRVTYEELSNHFGEKVATGVRALTKNEQLPKDAQMMDSLNRIMKLEKEVAIVKLADRCFNTRCVVPTWSKEKQQKYNIEAQLICDKLGYASKELKQKLQSNIDLVHKMFE